jgi:hypothetical protein
MDKNYVINNWNNFYKNYARLNPDLGINGINTKRLLLNHYVTCGFNENRKLIYENPVLDNKNTVLDNKNIVVNNKNTIILDESMIIEKLID